MGHRTDRIFHTDTEPQPEVGQRDDRDPGFPDPLGRLRGWAGDALGGGQAGGVAPCRPGYLPGGTLVPLVPVNGREAGEAW